MRELTSSAHSAVLEIETQTSAALRAHRTEYQSVTDSVHHLSGVLADLSMKTKDEIDNINGTAAAMRETLLAQHQASSGFWNWSQTGVFWLLEILLRGELRLIQM